MSAPSRVHRGNPGADGGAAAGPGVDRQAAPDGFDPVADVAQPAPGPAARVETPAVVGDRQLDLAGTAIPEPAGDPDSDPGRTGVLARVLHGLQSAEVDRGLHV